LALETQGVKPKTGCSRKIRDSVKTFVRGKKNRY